MAERESLADLHLGGPLKARRQRPVRGLVRGCLLTILAAFALLIGLGLWSDSRSPKPSDVRTAPAPIVAADPQPATTTPPAETSIDPAAELLADSPSDTAKPTPDLPPSFLEFEPYPKTSLDPQVLAVVLERRSPDGVPPTKPEALRAGMVANLRSADVIGITEAGIQLSLADGTSAFLAGVSTRNLVSGSSIAPGVVIVEGTSTFTTILGASRTGWTLKRISSADWSEGLAISTLRDEIDERNAIRREHLELAAELASIESREFKSADGRHTTTAVVVGYDREAKAYEMVRDDGRSIEVAEDRLNPESAARARTIAARITSAKRRMAAIETKLRD